MQKNNELPKSPTGIAGFDDITNGGLPTARTTLVCGGTGSCKTLFSMQFLVKGAIEFDEPGVFLSFEETKDELAQNVTSFGWDLPAMSEQKKIYLDHINIEKSEMEEVGDYSLQGLFLRIEAAVKAVNAKRIVIDTLEALFAAFTDENVIRAEIRRLFRWLKDKKLTAVITGEKGEKTFTRNGLEEYISDCVLFLDNRMIDQVCTRRLRIVKYRGTSHGTNEYPFILTDTGFSMFPITTLEMDYAIINERVSSGIDRLDTMLDGQGYFRGSSILISGTAGTGKTSFGASFAYAACSRNERVIYFSFEEAPSQIVRNMKSIGIDLKPAVEKGLLAFHSVRSTTYGLETHLAMMIDKINAFKPSIVVVDPISNFSSVSDLKDVKEVLTRIIDYMKSEGITALFTDLSHSGTQEETTEAAISSLMDTWVLLRDIEIGGERNRGLYLLKSRGMAHSNQIREYLITKKGIDLVDAYIGPSGVLTGTARIVQEAKEDSELLIQKQKIERLKRELKRKEKLLKSRYEDIKTEFDSSKEDMEIAIAEEEARIKTMEKSKERLGHMRWKDGNGK